jgi:hypothetical protein
MLDKSEESIRETLDACRDSLSRVHQSLESLHLKRLIDLLDARAPPLRGLLSWLLLGRDLGSHLLPSSFLLPQLEDLTAFLRLVRVEKPELLTLANELVRGSELAAATMVEIHLDLLIETEGWSHPVQVLERPRSGFRDLLAACRRRLREARGGKHQRLSEVRRLLERAVRIAESARVRRRRLRQASRR